MDDNKKIIALDSKLLGPMKNNLEYSLNLMIQSALMLHRNTEVNVKVSISVEEEVDANGKIYMAPEIQYKVTEKIKEPKGEYKGICGHNLAIVLDDEDNILVKDINEQQSLFEENKNAANDEDNSL